MSCTVACHRIKDIEAEIARTQKNKATAGHLGLLKVCGAFSYCEAEYLTAGPDRQSLQSSGESSWSLPPALAVVAGVTALMSTRLATPVWASWASHPLASRPS